MPKSDDKILEIKLWYPKDISEQDMVDILDKIFGNAISEYAEYWNNPKFTAMDIDWTYYYRE